MSEEHLRFQSLTHLSYQRIRAVKPPSRREHHALGERVRDNRAHAFPHAVPTRKSTQLEELKAHVRHLETTVLAGVHGTSNVRILMVAAAPAEHEGEARQVSSCGRAHSRTSPLERLVCVVPFSSFTTSLTG